MMGANGYGGARGAGAAGTNISGRERVRYKGVGDSKADNYCESWEDTSAGAGGTAAVTGATSTMTKEDGRPGSEKEVMRGGAREYWKEGPWLWGTPLLSRGPGTLQMRGASGGYRVVGARRGGGHGLNKYPLE